MTASMPAMEKWYKSRRSNPSGSCVEVARTRDGYAIRDSKNRGGPMLRVSTEAFRALVDMAKEYGV